MLFGDVSVVTCLPGLPESGGVNCGVDADFVQRLPTRMTTTRSSVNSSVSA